MEDRKEYSKSRVPTKDYCQNYRCSYGKKVILHLFEPFSLFFFILEMARKIRLGKTASG